MADVTGRIAYNNLAIAPASILTASSQQPTSPLAWLRDPLASKTWRSLVGWNITAQWTKLDFTEAGTARVATVAAGNYPDGASMAAAVQTAMNAAPGHTNTYTVTYDSATHKFTIARNTGANALVLKFAAGAPNFSTAIHHDLGFNDTDLAATSSTAQNGAYKSREWIKVDMGSAQAIQIGIVWNHNSGAGGTYTLFGNATDAWTAPSTTQALVGDGTIRLLQFSQSFRWWELVIDDVFNPLGYSELSPLYIGTYVTPAEQYSYDFSKTYQGLSEIAYGDHGAVFQTVRPRRRVWSLEYYLVQDADRILHEAFIDAMPNGSQFFFLFDALNVPANTVYVFRIDDPVVTFIRSGQANPLWSVKYSIAEALE